MFVFHLSDFSNQITNWARQSGKIKKNIEILDLNTHIKSLQQGVVTEGEYVTPLLGASPMNIATSGLIFLALFRTRQFL